MVDFMMQGGVYAFEVNTKTNTRVILQIDFRARQVQILEGGKEKTCCSFHNCTSVINQDALWFQIKLKDSMKRLEATNIKEKRVIFSILYSAIGRSPFAGVQDDAIVGKPIGQAQLVIKEGFLEKKGHTIMEKWAKRLVSVKPGQFLYYKPYMKNPLHIISISEQTCYVERDSKVGFKVVVKDRNRTFWFRLTADSNKEDNNSQFERNEWIMAFEQACRDVRRTILIDPLDQIDSPLDTMCEYRPRDAESGTSRGSTVYSDISSVSASFEECVSSGDTRDLPLTGLGRTINSQMLSQTLPSRRPSGREYPPPLPQRVTILPLKDKQRYKHGETVESNRPRTNTGPHDYPRGSNQWKRSQSEKHISTTRHASRLSHARQGLHMSLSDTVLPLNNTFEHEVPMQTQREIPVFSEKLHWGLNEGTHRFPTDTECLSDGSLIQVYRQGRRSMSELNVSRNSSSGALPGPCYQTSLSDTALLSREVKNRVNQRWQYESYLEKDRDYFKRISHAYMNTGNVARLEIPENDDTYLNPTLERGFRMSCTSTEGSTPYSVTGNEDTDSDSDEDDDEQASYSFRRSIISVHSNDIMNTPQPEATEVESVKPLGWTERRQGKTNSYRSDYSSGCSFLGSPGVQADDENVLNVPESVDEEVETRDNSHSMQEHIVSQHISAIIPTETLESITKERPKRPSRKPSRKTKQTTNEEDASESVLGNNNHDIIEIDEKTAEMKKRIDCSEPDSGNESCYSEMGARSPSLKDIESWCNSQNASSIIEELEIMQETIENMDISTSREVETGNDMEQKQQTHLTTGQAQGDAVVEYV